MKIIKYLIVFLLIVSCQQNNKEEHVKNESIKRAVLIHSRIDSLNTEAEIQQLVRHADTNYKKFEIRKIADFDRSYRGKDNDSLTKILAKKLKIDKSFYKADLDNNGFTDLIAIGDNHSCSVVNFDSDKKISCDFTILAVMNFGKNSLIIKRMQKNHDEAFVPVIKVVDGLDLVAYSRMNYKYYRQNPKPAIYEKSNLMTYKFGNFIEYSKTTTKHKIKKIEFSSGACFGTCPIFKIVIDGNRRANLSAEEYNYERKDDLSYIKKPNELKGNYTSMITKEKYQEMADLINYLNIESLSNDYMAGGTCQPSSNLIISYDNGKVKTIGDYGVNGTSGLRSLYNMLYDLRFNQKWTKVKD